MREDWRDEAACAGTDPDAWFGDPDKLKFKENSTIYRICNSCPVQAECLDWAVRHEAHGYWAGTMPAERQWIRRQRNILLEPPEVKVLGHVFSKTA